MLSNIQNKVEAPVAEPKVASVFGETVSKDTGLAVDVSNGVGTAVPSSSSSEDPINFF